MVEQMEAETELSGFVKDPKTALGVCGNFPPDTTKESAFFVNHKGEGACVTFVMLDKALQ